MAGRSKSRLHCRQPTEKLPRQSRVVGQDNPLSFENHSRYIANRFGFDNEASTKKKGPHCGPLMHVCAPLALFLRGGLESFRSRRALRLGNARLLAAQSAQIIELGTAYFAAAHDFDRVDHRRIEREYALDALPV
jgi:hypothetical protein